MIAARDIVDSVLETSHALHARGWVANHDGNITVQLGAGRYLATPTATSKAKITADNLLVVDDSGERIEGNGRRFSEVNLHLAVYAERDDVNAVVHAHPPYATAIACSGSDVLARPFIAEAVVSLGASIPTIPFAVPGPDAAAALTRAVGDVDAVLLANHGVVSWGPNLELAYLRMELVEHLARIAITAQAVGGVRPLPESAFEPLLAARAKAGLGKAAERAAIQRVVACAPAPHAPHVEIIPDSHPKRDLESIVREEIARALRRE